MFPVDKEKPDFGLVGDLKVVGAMTGVAQPVAAQILAENGADVIWIESTVSPDVGRMTFDWRLEGERRNMRNLSVNLNAPEGRKVLLELIEDADILMEGFKGDQMKKWGLTDEVLWEINPRLVISHSSGYGQEGLEDYIKRPSYDMIGQAFSGYMDRNSPEDGMPKQVGPQVADYVTALFNCVGILMAVYHAKRTGIGESIDSTLFESMMRINYDNPTEFTDHRRVPKTVEPSTGVGTDPLQCADGKWIYTCIVSVGVMKKACEFLGIEYGVDPLFPKGTSMVFKGTPAGDLLTEKLEAYAASVPSEQAEAEFVAAGVPCSRINATVDLQTHPHVVARKTLETITNAKGAEVTYVGPVPHMKKTPARTWRRSPYIGEHNEEILSELGYSEDRIKEMYDEGLLNQDKDLLFVYPYKAPGQPD